MTDIKLTHPGSKQTITVDESRAEAYQSQGWTEVESKSKGSEKS